MHERGIFNNMPQHDYSNMHRRRPQLRGINNAEITFIDKEKTEYVDEQSVVATIRNFLAVSPTIAKKMAQDSIAIVAALRKPDHIDVVATRTSSTTTHDFNERRCGFLRNLPSSRNTTEGSFGNGTTATINNNSSNDDNEVCRDTRTDSSEESLETCVGRELYYNRLRQSTDIQRERTLPSVLHEVTTRRKHTRRKEYETRGIRRSRQGRVARINFVKRTNFDTCYDGWRVLFHRLREGTARAISVRSTLSRSAPTETEKN